MAQNSPAAYVFGPLRASQRHQRASTGKSELDVHVCIPNTPQFVQNCPQIVIWSTIASNILSVISLVCFNFPFVPFDAKDSPSIGSPQASLFSEGTRPQIVEGPPPKGVRRPKLDSSSIASSHAVHRSLFRYASHHNR